MLAAQPLTASLNYRTAKSARRRVEVVCEVYMAQPRRACRQARAAAARRWEL